MSNNVVKIDVCDLPCPEPVIKVKNALKNINKESLKLSEFEIIGNGSTSKENIARYLESQGFTFTIGKSIEGGYMIMLKDKNDIAKKDLSSKITKKMMLIKSDKVGEGELGNMLANGFIKSLLESDVLPWCILFINKGVLLTTDNKEVDNTEIVEALKELEKLGVEIYSCGSCLTYFALTERLKVGKIGNSLEGIQNMINSDSLISL